MSERDVGNGATKQDICASSCEGLVESMPDTSPGFTDQQKHLLSRLDRLQTEISNTHSTLDRKLQFNFALMSSILTLIIVGKISWFEPERLKPFETTSFLLFSLSFASTALLLLYAHWPREVLTAPVTPTWESLETWWGYPPDEYAEQALLSYESIWNTDLKVRARKATLVMVSHIAVVIALLAVIEDSIGLLATIWYRLVP